MNSPKRVKEEQAQQSAPSYSAEEIAVERLNRLRAMGELVPMVQAARDAGFRAINMHVLHRAAMTGALLTCKIGGVRYSHPTAILEWIAASSALPERAPRAQRGRGRRTKPKTSAAAKAYLRARGLPTGEEGV